MANSTLEGMDPISGASPSTIELTDLLYLFRPASPDEEYKVVGQDIVNLIEAEASIPSTNVAPTIITGANLNTMDLLMDHILSAGWLSGGEITDDTDGTISVAAGNGVIRATDSVVDSVLSFTWAAENGANVALVDNDLNFIYVEYNGGNPQVVATNVERADTQTNILLSKIFRAGTALHIDTEVKTNIANHAGSMHIRLVQTLAFARVTGGILAETGTRNFSISGGSWWEGLNPFTTNAFDSDDGGAGDEFVYYYSDGASGFTEVAASDTIDNLQFDDGSGSLATLGNSRFGVHWVFLSTNSSVHVMYGEDSYTLVDAEDADIPAAQPELFEVGTRLVGKIIIGKSDSVYTAIESAFDTTFETASPTDHENLTNLLGGAPGNHYHVTSAERDVAVTKVITFTHTDPAVSVATGDNKAFIIVTEELAGMDIISAQANADVAPTGAEINVQIHNETSGVNVFSTALTIDATEKTSTTAGTPVVIDAAEDDLTLGDKIRLDIDGVGSTIAGAGLFVTLRCRLP